MTYSFTLTESFTRTSAKYLASKVAADLRRLQSYYGQPSDSAIQAFSDELTELLANDYVKSVEYGFRKGEVRVVSLFYEVQANGLLTDGHSGGVYARADVSGATWFSFMTPSDKWNKLPSDEQRRFEEKLPIKRSAGEPPKDGAGYWVSDRSYFADGVGTTRRTFRPY
jgi:hypothetical protein